MKFSELSVFTESNEPERISLDGYTLKVGGKELSLDGQWVDIVSTDSQVFKDMRLRVQRDALSGDTTRTHDEIDSLVKSALISSWSFEEPCNEENKLQALKVWPSSIVNFLVKRAESRIDVNFTKGKSEA